MRLTKSVYDSLCVGLAALKAGSGYSCTCLYTPFLQFLKSVKRFSDKNCGKNKELEQLGEPSETKTALA